VLEETSDRGGAAWADSSPAGLCDKLGVLEDVVPGRGPKDLASISEVSKSYLSKIEFN
jgi:hypothetical protein